MNCQNLINIFKFGNNLFIIKHQTSSINRQTGGIFRKNKIKTSQRLVFILIYLLVSLTCPSLHLEKLKLDRQLLGNDLFYHEYVQVIQGIIQNLHS